MDLGRLLEACQEHEKVGLEHSSKSTKYELEGSYKDPVHEHVSFLKAAKLPQVCKLPAHPLVLVPGSSKIMGQDGLKNRYKSTFR